ncbi:type I polyketide synthase [Corynebacterium pseudopelargi]|uniref:3-oxoacyl-[acyl-carrier-protein] synthase 2 n=1 Tax=Corynebacterium pseudopelargi TaxID=2080757 RepID=A0A3G6ISQ9_9CORY|nr:3-oxoacyl-[acyl-carrier-protein] synthase 2 [Corynebacterium pseudopelargi]
MNDHKLAANTAHDAPRLVSTLSDTPFALVFAGQGVDWLETLREALAQGATRTIEPIVSAAAEKLTNVADQIIGTRPFGFAPLDWAKQAELAPQDPNAAALSVPGILVAQLATLDVLERQGLDIDAAQGVIGHSQGVLGKLAVDDLSNAAEVLAVAELIGAAISRHAHICGLLRQGELAPMISIAGISKEQLQQAIEASCEHIEPSQRPVIGLRNTANSYVLVGRPQDNQRVVEHLQAQAKRSQAEIEQKLRGGSAFSPKIQALPIEVGFHHPLMAEGVEQVVAWASAAGIDSALARQAAEAVMLNPVDWPAQIHAQLEGGARWFLDVGPAEGVSALSAQILKGSGAASLAVATQAGQAKLFDAGQAPALPVPYSAFAPKLHRAVDGSVRIATKFTNTTGRSPILLAGMTPTTVDPGIVAAAANAGHWAELAGGGQVTPEILEANIEKLSSLLEPGVNAQFNSMFLDPYLWKMQIGGKRLVPKARKNGAPIDGIVITAGLPEHDDAVALVRELRAEGFPWIAFKPGALKHIRKVLAIAADVPDVPIIMHVEGGKAGGHHSWEDLDELLIGSYDDIRAHDNAILCVGGGIGTPERAADYLTGSWARRYGLPDMPVDGILVGTAAMATKEATTSEAVKQLLVETPGSSQWVPAGGAASGMASGRSQLGADIHEIDNSFARAGRLLDQVAGDAEAVEQQREEIIEAIAKTAKPYFGDVHAMTYQQWLERYLELSGPYQGKWTDQSWADRFAKMLERTEARLHPQDHGEFDAQVTFDVDDPHASLKSLLEHYPGAASQQLHPADVAWFLQLARTPGKPVNFVPVIDQDVRRWWRSDSLWQSHDERYSADQVAIIPGIEAVAGIDRANEPVAELFARFIQATQQRLEGQEASQDSALEAFIQAPDISWAGRISTNPVHRLGGVEQWHLGKEEATHPASGAVLRLTGPERAALDVPLNASAALTLPLTLNPVPGGAPLLSREDAEAAMDELCRIAAGGQLPKVSLNDGVVSANWQAELSATDIADYRNVTESHLPAGITAAGVAPDVLVGKAWPAIFATVAAARVPGNDAARAVEGMLNLVHLEHHITMLDDRIVHPGSHIEIQARAEEVHDTTIGRLVLIRAELFVDETLCAKLSERMAIRGRRGSDVARTNTSALPSVADAPRSFRAQAILRAPQSMHAFAAVSGDHNPIHTSDTAAALAGLPGVIVHGMWTSAMAELVASSAYADETVSTPAAKIKEFTATMLAPVLPGQEIEFVVERSGIDTRPGCGEVREVTATVDGTVVLSATAVMAQARTFYAFPGQGIQHQGMGMEARARSAAAREVWERADAHTRNQLGFSVLHIVEHNPTEVRVQGETFTHPKGVLFLTQFTQVAMATLGVAQVAEMREAGVLQERAFFAGHSVGEYNALAAFAGVLSLENVLEIVYRRGLTMHRLVQRDEEGNSNYGLAALRPHKMGLSASEVFEYVQQCSEASGEFLEIVNFNLEGKQYAVAGTAKGLRALAADAESRAPGARAFIQIPGIDVPFHSTQLLDGVDDFREHLDQLIPEDVDLDVLVGHYVPNLVARPFELSKEFIQAMCDVVDAPVLHRIMEDFDTWANNPVKLGRTLLVELLAWQFASPVRWIETQDLLLDAEAAGGLGVERFVEVGVANAPTLSNLLAQTQALAKHRDAHVEILNVERDRAIVFATDELQRAVSESPEAGQEQHTTAPEPDAAVQAVNQQPTEVAPAAPSGAARPEDLSFGPAEATAMLIALWTKVRPDQMAPNDSIEALVEGVSSRRNQLLLDLGVEFGLGAIDGAADAELADLKATLNRMAKGYSPFGPVLSDAISDALRRITGPTGKRPGYIAERVGQTWELGPGWVQHVTAAVVLGAREGASLRGGDLATLSPAAPSSASELDSLIDEAVKTVAAAHGVQVSLPGGSGAGGGVVDSAALGAFAEQVTGEQGVLAATARTILENLGLNDASSHDFDPNDGDAAVVELVTKELGSDWLRQVAPSFDAKKATLIDDRWASAREDLSRIAAGEQLDVSFRGAGEIVAVQAEYLGLDWAAQQARDHSKLDYADDVAVVSGASPGSIATAVVERLLAGGATVVLSTSSLNHDRLEFYKQLYRGAAQGQAALWVVPANLSSFSDLDALVEWIGTEQVVTVNGASKVLKPALVPTLLFPFAAPRVSGSLMQAGAQSELQMRLLLWSVERLIAGLSGIGHGTHVGERLHVVLPGSPNRGRFGGDGAYGESKAALDALVNRWNAESSWQPHTSLVHMHIGWVRGTGLMGGNDPLVEAVEAAGVQTYSTQEMAEKLVQQISPEVRAQAAKTPVVVDATGGLGQSDVNLSELAQKVRAQLGEQGDVEKLEAKIQALPNLPEVLTGNAPDFQGQVSQSLEDMVVIVGAGELGPWGSARTRFEAELHGDLSAAGVAELAWTMGLIHWDEDPKPGWYDQDDQPVEEAEIYQRFHDEVLARVGVRRYHNDFGMVDNLAPELTNVYLDRDLSFNVADEAAARSFVESEPESTTALFDETSGEWVVTRKAGSAVRVPRRMAMSRFVGGQIPEGFDPSVYGIPADMVDNLDRVALWNIVCTVDAFLSAGFSPAELLAAMHPARVSSTQGTGLGGMQSMRSLYIDGMLAEPRQNDILQEALPNVMAAHVMQSYVGGYGQMIHPVAACATAAVSVEEGVDKIKLGKSDFVVAGGYDDLSIEGITGFGDMAATADSNELAAKGIEERYFSRANDRRRAGFVESAGGGTVLLARGSVAADLGLPVLGVIGFAESFADGAHQSIPAPGLGALGAARGGSDSRLARALQQVGVSADDVKIVSKHDTSTNANDPNESDLHERIARAIGRSEGNPLYVISQKTLTGHAKGGAAAFQLVGLTQVLATGMVPANMSLDCVDPVLAENEHLVWLRHPLDLSHQAPKAGFVTSLGFGHVSALIAVVHAGAFEAALLAQRGDKALQQWRSRAHARLYQGARTVLEGMYGVATLYERPKDRNLGNVSAKQQKEREAAILLDEKARLIEGVLRTH